MLLAAGARAYRISLAFKHDDMAQAARLLFPTSQSQEDLLFH
jgi:hypothetical protein